MNVWPKRTYRVKTPKDKQKNRIKKVVHFILEYVPVSNHCVISVCNRLPMKCFFQLGTVLHDPTLKKSAVDQPPALLQQFSHMKIAQTVSICHSGLSNYGIGVS